MKLKGTKSEKSSEKGRKEFMKSAKLSHAQLEDKNNACGSFKCKNSFLQNGGLVKKEKVLI